VLDLVESKGFILVLLVGLVVFGSKRLPDSARALGRSLRILKAEAKGLREDDEPAKSADKPTGSSTTEVTQLPPVTESAPQSAPPQAQQAQAPQPPSP
jgi:sec-independent protein translocase protein TatA